MRLTFCLFISLLAHAFVLLTWQLSLHIKPKLNSDHQALQVLIDHQISLQKRDSIKDKAVDVSTMQTLPINAINKSKNIDQPARRTVTPNVSNGNVNSIVIQGSMEATNDNKAVVMDYSNYYAVADVDKKALPQTNIDDSTIRSNSYSGLPIKLRLYINASGKLVKIEPIALLDQDLEYATKLEKLLSELVFLPAKKNGLEVDSYQDIQFSFNPLPISDELSGLNK